jgi:hypothetical protein
MKNRECVSCIKRKTPYCPTSMECMATEDMPYYQNRMMLLKENQELKEKLDKYENPEDMTLMMMWCTEKVKDENEKLKKQLEELERGKWVKDSRKQIENKLIEGIDNTEILGNILNYLDSLYLSIDNQLYKIKEYKTQQKEFIKYLEDGIKQYTPSLRWKHYNEDGFNDYDVENPSCIKVQPTDKIFKEILQKYKSIIGVSDENNIK